MTSWNYRIVRHQGSPGWLGVHEVFYDAAGKPIAVTADPVSFSCEEDEGPEGLVKSLELALADAKSRPVLNENEIGSEEVPGLPVEIIDGVNDFASEDPRSPSSIVRASEISVLIALLEDEYSLPDRAAGPLSTSLEWEEIKRRLTGIDPLNDDIFDETTIEAMREARDDNLESITLDDLRSALDKEG